MKKNNVLNDIDKKILSVLQENADLPISELSKKVNLSATPCWARINKLYKQGFITKKVAVVDRLKLNLNVVAFVQVKTSNHNMEWARKFVKVISDMPEVIEFYRLSGSIDYLLKVLVPSIEKYDEFYKKLTDKVDLTDVSSSFSMEEIKQTSSLPLDYA
ncbi:MAG: Lrp/AsnC family transcriptional regulator [Pelagibacteraceae bacterium]|jgi:Lrp/AsnC family transcriptional regulator|nr:Lrp/AsnC family transcriptional regulator [Candidatus Pelagibacter sp.]MDA9168396.1 Lrp/AsnC family transcriptional regulator [Pelagibacteraceae bacterium]MDB0036228.1 Lrp/AsnC family transcriptional regulator [Pelagibacteraceae bacterium]|tara:strand:+ start:175 stop:651 length:477 start_codon:yes stop_codon:yes gene_type:complete